MKTLYIGEIPENVEAHKDDDPNRFGVKGKLVYASEAFDNILRYSTFDLLVVPSSVGRPRYDFRDTELYLDNRSRIKFVGEHELSQLSRLNIQAMHFFGQHLSIGARQRRIANLPSVPITGVVHALNYTSQLLNTFLILTSPLKPFDAMLCSSCAGQQVFKRFIALMTDRLHRIGVAHISPSIQTPVIPLGVNTDRFSSVTETNLLQELNISERPVILYFGRMSDTSKADLAPLIVTFSRLIKNNFRASLIIAGDDTQAHISEGLRQLASELGCASHVRVLPNVSRVQKLRLYHEADVFVAIADSIQETFGITVVEAMAAGLAIVASDWSGYRDILVDEVTGYLVRTIMPMHPPEFDELFGGSGGMNDVDLLAATTTVDLVALYRILSVLITKPDLRRELGLAALRRARAMFDWKVVVASYENLWERLSREGTCETTCEAVPVLDLERYDYRELFADYASELLTAQSRVVVTSLGSGSSYVESQICEIAAQKPKLLDVASLNAILRLVEQTGPVPICDLMAQREMAGLHLGTTEMMIGICRLLKYGLIDIDSGDQGIRLYDTVSPATSRTASLSRNW